MRRGVREGGSHRGVAAPKKHVPSLLERWKQEKVCDGPKGRAQKYEIDTTQSQTTTTGTILPRVAELSWSEIGPFTYNGEQQAPTATVANKVGTDDVSFIVAGAQTNVGTYVGSSAASVTELTGADEENYVMPASPDTMPFSITKADQEVTGVEAINSTYSGESQALLSEGGTASGGGAISYGVT